MRAKVPPATCFPRKTQNAKRILRCSDTAWTCTRIENLKKEGEKKLLFCQSSVRGSALQSIASPDPTVPVPSAARWAWHQRGQRLLTSVIWLWCIRIPSNPAGNTICLYRPFQSRRSSRGKLKENTNSRSYEEAPFKYTSSSFKHILRWLMESKPNKSCLQKEKEENGGWMGVWGGVDPAAECTQAP